MSECNYDIEKEINCLFFFTAEPVCVTNPNIVPLGKGVEGYNLGLSNPYGSSGDPGFTGNSVFDHDCKVQASCDNFFSMQAHEHVCVKGVMNSNILTRIA